MTALSMITAHDHSEATTSPIMIAFTTGSAVMKRWIGFIMLVASAVIRESLRRPVICAGRAWRFQGGVTGV